MLTVVGYIAATALHGLDLALNAPGRRTPLRNGPSARVLVVGLVADGQVMSPAQDQVCGSAADRASRCANRASSLRHGGPSVTDRDVLVTACTHCSWRFRKRSVRNRF
jgi:hypothetical protein